MITLKRIILGFSLLFAMNSMANTIVAKANGNWNAVGTWLGGVVPGLNDSAVIPNTFTVNLAGGPTTVYAVYVQTGGILNGAGQTLMIRSSVTGLTNAGTVTFTTGTLIDSGGFYNNGGVFTWGTGTLKMAGTANQVLGGTSPSTFYNLNINNTGVSAYTVTLGSAITVTNTLTLTAGVLDVSASNYQVTIEKTFNNSSTSTTVSGALGFNAETGTVDLGGGINGPITITNGGGIQTTTFYNLTADANTNTITSNHAEIVNNNLTITNCILSTGGTYTIGGSATVSAGSTWTLTGGTLNITGNLLNNGTFTLGGSNFNINGNLTNNGTYTAPTGGTTTFQATAVQNQNQTIGGTAPVSFWALTINNQGVNDTIKLTQPITVGNNMTVTTGVVNCGTNQITGSANRLTLGANTTLILGTPTSNTVISCPVFTNYTINASSTIIYQSDGNQTIAFLPSYGNLYIYSGTIGGIHYTASFTPTANITINGNLIIGNGTSSGVTLNVANNAFTVTVIGNVTTGTDGTLSFADKGSMNIEGNFSNNNAGIGFVSGYSTITFNSTAGLNQNQTINSVTPLTFYSLISANAGATNNKVTLGNSITTNGSLQINGASNLDVNSVGNYQITCDSNFTNNQGLTGFSAQHGTVLFNGPTNVITGNPTTFYNMTVGASGVVTSTANNQNVGNNFLVNVGGSINITGRTFTVTGTVTNGGTMTVANGTLTVTGAVSNTGIMSFSTGAFNVANSITNSGTISYSGNANITTTTASGNLINNGTGTITCSTGGTITVSGSLTSSSTATPAITTTTGNITVSGATSITAGSISLGTGIYTSTGNFTIGSGATVIFSSTGTLNDQGDFTNNGTFTAGNSTVNMNATLAEDRNQNINGTSATTFYNLAALNLGTAPAINDTILLGRAITIGNNLTLTNGVLACKTHTITGPGGGSGIFTMSNGSTFILGLPTSNTFVAFPTFLTTTLNNTSTVIYQADTNQSIATVNYSNLYIYSGNIGGKADSATPSSISNFNVSQNLIVGNGTSSGVTLSVPLTNTISVVNGNATIGTDGTIAYSGGGTLNVNTGTLTNNGTLSSNGGNTFTIFGNTTNNGTIKFTGAGAFNERSDLNNNGTFTCGTSTAQFVGTAGQNHNQNINSTTPITFWNLTGANAGATNDTVFLNKTATVNGNFTINNGGGVFNCQTNTMTGNSGGTLTLGTNTTLILGLQSSVTSVPFPDFKVVALSGSSTVIYQANAAQTVEVKSSFTPFNTVNYGNLDIYTGSASSSKTLSNTNNFIIVGNLNIGNGTSTGVSTLALTGANTNIITVEGNFMNNGVFTPGASTIKMAATLAQNQNQIIGGTAAITTFNNLTINNLGSTNTSVTLGNPISVATGATLTLTAGILDVSVSNYQITCDGTFTNNIGTAGFNAEQGTVDMGGATSSSVINGTSSTTFYNLTADPASGHTVTSTTDNETVNNNLLVVSGNLILNATTLTVGANATINSGATTTFTSGTLNIAGNYSNSGTFTSGTGLVNFDGASAETMGGSTNTGFYNLTLNNSTGLTATSSETVNHTLTLTSGNITLGANTLTIGSAATISGGSSTSYVVTNGAGTLSKIFSGAGTFSFPVGDNAVATDYTPLSLTINSASTFPGTVNVLTVNSKDPHNNSSVNYLNRYWTVTETGLGAAFSFNETGSYLVGDVAGTESAIASGLWSGSTPWTKYAAVNTGTHQVTNSTAITSAGDITGITLAAPTVSITGTSPCDIKATTTGDDPVVTYLWAPGSATTAAISAASTNTYTVTITDGNGFTATANKAIIALSTTASVNTEVSCNGGTNGNATTATSGGTAPYTYSWSNSVPTVVSTSQTTGAILTAGNYTVTATDAIGCTTTSTVTITEPTAPAVTIASQTNVLCHGSSTGSITANAATGGTGAFTYAWTPSGGATLTASSLAANTYTITATDANGCTATANATLTEPASSPAVTIASQVNVLCRGNSTGSITANAATGGTGAFTYAWTPSGGTTLTASALSAQGYTITATDANGCTATANATVTQPASLPSITIASQVNVLCHGASTGSITANAATGGTGAFTYAWTPSGGATLTASSLAANTYTITATDANGCTATANATLTEPASSPTVTIASQVNILCHGSSTGSITANAATGGTGAFTYAWTPSGGTTLTASSLAANTYTITAKDANGCTTTANATLTQPGSSPVITIASHVNVLCHGASTGSITANAATGGTGAFTYTWSPSGGTNLTASSLTAQGYTITATDANGCTATANFTITQPGSSPAITIASHVNILCHGNSTGSITANAATGGTGAFTYAWTPSGGTNLVASSLTAQGYTITATDANGCTATANATLTQPGSSPTVTIASQVNELCHGASTGSITANAATGGTGAFTYAWTPSGGATLTASSLAANTYTITATDANGCTATANATLTQPGSSPAVTIASQVNELCHGASTGSITANAATGGTGAFTYAWSPSGGTNLTASSLSSQGYTVTATDGNGCTATASTTVTQPTAPSITIASQVNELCTGNSSGSITANAATGGTGAFTYAWTPSGGTNLTASSLTAQGYTITATDVNGCTATANATVTQPASLPAITIASQVNVLCHGASTGSITANAATGGTGAFTYSWTPSGGTNLVASSLSGQGYTVTATDANGCTATANATLIQPATSPVITIASQVNDLCHGSSNGSITANAATGGTGSFTYAWTPSGGTNLTASSLTAQGYTITAIDDNECTATASATITEPASTSTVTIASQINELCNGGNTGSITANPASGGTGAFTYAWSPSGGTNLVASSLSSQGYTITATDANGCTSTASTTITQPSAPAITIASQVNELCNGNSAGSITANAATGGTGTFTYAWTPSGGTNLTASSLTAQGYTITATDANGCTATATTTVTEPTLLSASASVVANVTCTGGSNGNLSVSPSGGTPLYSFSWVNSLSSVVSTANPTGAILNADTYTVTVTDANGCTATASASIIELHTLPNVTISGNVIGGFAICSGNTDTLIANATGGSGSGYAYSWNDGSTTAADLETAAGSYTITVTDGNGCMNTANQSVTVNSLPSASITGNIAGVAFTVCSGNIDTLTAGATGGSGSNYSFSWNDGSSTNTDLETLAGTYTVTVTDGNGCMNTASQMVTVNTTPTVTVTPNSPGLCTGGSVNMNATGAASYTWSPSTALDVTTGSSVNANPVTTITYTIVGTTGTCSGKDSAVVSVASSLSVSVLPASPTICMGNNVTLNANGASTFTWRSSTGLSCTTCPSPSANPTITTTYTVVGSSGTCSDSANVVVTVNTLPNASVTGNISGNTICAGNTDSLTANATGNGPFTYSWTDGSTNDTALVVPVNTNTVTVTVTDMNGCSNMASQTVTVNAVPAITITGNVISGTVICKGGMDTLMANAVGNGPFSYNWSTSGTNDTVVVSNANVYLVTVTDANGCTHTSSTNVTNNISSLGITGTSSVNAGAGDTLTANGGTNYMWSTGSTSDTTMIAPMMQTTYSVTGVDFNGCVDTATFIVMINPPLSVNSLSISDNTTLYPNPAVTTVNLSFKMAGSGKSAIIKLIDLTGKEVMSTNTTISNGQVMPIDISGLTMGTYFVKIITENSSQVVRFIKQ